MKALCKKEAKPGIWMVKDAPVPEPGPSDVLIKIRKTSICGTDIHIYNWDEWSQKNVPVPLITGHEWMGEVVKIGADVKNIEVGERVTGENHLTCGTCRNCRAGKQHLCIHTRGIGYHVQGAFADYFKIPASNIFKLPKDISDDIAAFFDPLGNAVHTALSFDLVGEDVLITGGGPIGCMAAGICRFAGARHVVVTDVNPYRLELAKKMGASRAVNVSKTELRDVMKELGMSEGFDVGMEMSGAPPAVRQMLSLMRHGGKIAMLGIPPKDMSVDWNQVIFKGLFIKGVYGREMYETWYKMKAMVQSGLDLSPMITHTFEADDFQKAFDVMASGESGKSHPELEHMTCLKTSRNLAWVPQPNVVEMFLTEEMPPMALCTAAYVLAFDGDRILMAELDRGPDIPGGHIEPGETPEQAARREVTEETGAQVRNVRLFAVQKMTIEGPKPEGYQYPYPVSYQLMYMTSDVTCGDFIKDDDLKGAVFITPQQAKDIPWLQENRALYEYAFAQRQKPAAPAPKP